MVCIISALIHFCLESVLEISIYIFFNLPGESTATNQQFSALHICGTRAVGTMLSFITNSQYDKCFYAFLSGIYIKTIYIYIFFKFARGEHYHARTILGSPQLCSGLWVAHCPL